MKILDDLKQAEELARTSVDHPLYELILLIRAQVLELQERILLLTQENTALRSELSSLKEARDTKSRMVFERSSYWERKPDGGSDGPYCSNCWDNRQTPVRMVSRPNPAYMRCPTCQIDIEVFPEKNVARSTRPATHGRRRAFDD